MPVPGENQGYEKDPSGEIAENDAIGAGESAHGRLNKCRERENAREVCNENMSPGTQNRV
jgi:hypothetical protein